MISFTQYLLMITIFLTLIDFSTTLYGLSQGYKESNPLGFLQSTFINVLLIIIIIKLDAIISNLEVLT